MAKTTHRYPKRNTKKPGRFRIPVYTAVFLTTIFCSAVSAGPNDDRALKIKAAYIYNIINFVEWPDPNIHKNDSITIYILGKSPFDNLFEPVMGRTIKGKKLVIKNIDSPETIKPGSLVFICRSEKNRLESIIHTLKQKAVLTLSDIQDFTRRGGMICLPEKDERIKLLINVGNIKRENIIISSKLLELATLTD